MLLALHFYLSRKLLEAIQRKCQYAKSRQTGIFPPHQYFEVRVRERLVRESSQ